MAHPEIGFTLQEGGRTLLSLLPCPGDPEAARLERLRAALTAGRLVAPASRAELERFVPVEVR